MAAHNDNGHPAHEVITTLNQCHWRQPNADSACGLPANTRRSPNVGLMLARRLRRRTNINPTLDEGLLFAGLWVDD